MRRLAAGLGLTAAVTVVLWLGWGPAAVVPGVVFGALATGIQMLAVRALRRGWNGSTAEFIEGFGVGMAYRAAGVGFLAAACLLDGALFPPLPTCLAFLGVLLPLLFFEMRFAR